MLRSCGSSAISDTRTHRAAARAPRLRPRESHAFRTGRPFTSRRARYRGSVSAVAFTKWAALHVSTSQGQHLTSSLQNQFEGAVCVIEGDVEPVQRTGHQSGIGARLKGDEKVVAPNHLYARRTRMERPRRKRL